MFGTAFLLRGGHLGGVDRIDSLLDGKLHRFGAARIPVAGSHGAGCTLSAAVAAVIAQGEPLSDAVQIAKNYLVETLSRSYGFRCASGEFVHALNQGTIFPKNEA